MPLALTRHLGWPVETRYPAQGALIARHHLACSTNNYTSLVGLRILESGGNAVDAAIAMAAVHVVVNPFVGHLGGDTFMLIYDAKSGNVVALNASGPAPSGANIDFFRKVNGIPEKGPLSASIPGTVDGWAMAHDRFGNRPFGELLEPAIRLARDGFVVSASLARHFARSTGVFARFPSTAKVFLPNGKPPRAGEVLCQGDLAQTLETIAREGRDAFYTGALAANIANQVQQSGGLFSEDDLGQYHAEWKAPVKGTYRGFTVYEQPLASQGMLLLQMLNIVENASLSDMPVDGSEALHHMLEAKKLAFADRDRYYGDPRFTDVPIIKLLDKAYAAEQFRRIDPAQAMVLPSSGSKHVSDTDYFCVADEDGNAVSYIHSLFPGSGFVIEGTGIMLNSRMTSFTLEPSHPNHVAPGKHPLHTLNSYMVMEDGKLCLVGGSTAGDLQVQFNLQFLSRLIDGNMQLHQAYDAPRWGVRTGDAVQIEERNNGDTLDGLVQRGHQVVPLGPWGHTGRAHAIAFDRSRNIMVGHSESRDDGGFVLGY